MVSTIFKTREGLGKGARGREADVPVDERVSDGDRELAEQTDPEEGVYDRETRDTVEGHVPQCYVREDRGGSKL